MTDKHCRPVHRSAVKRVLWVLGNAGIFALWVPLWVCERLGRGLSDAMRRH